jgi:MFS family permease
VVITQPLCTTFSDVFGRKPSLYVAFLLFTAGSLIFALAQNLRTIIAGRVLQGLGGGGLDLLSEVIVADITTLQERSLYLGLMAIPIAIRSIPGPALGAVFSSFVSWRWIGGINLPLLGVAFLLVFFFLRLRPLDTSFKANMKRIDWGGISLSLSGITAFILPLSWASALYP